MTEQLSVSAHHLSGELIKVEFAHSYLISDHPASLGGGGKGPTPAALLLSALVSSIAIDARQAAKANAIKLGPITVRASQRIDQEGFTSELQSQGLPAKTFLGQIWLRVDFTGETSKEEEAILRAAVDNNPILRTLENGLKLQEELKCIPISGPIKPQEKNPLHLQPEHSTTLAEGDFKTLIKPDGWRVSAVSLDDESCILNLGNTCLVVGANNALQIGPSPDELLQGALAACTTVYVARNAALLDMPVADVSTQVGVQRLPEARGCYTTLEKQCTVSGQLTEEQKARLEHIARYCAIGVTLERGVLFDKDLSFSQGEASPTGAPLEALRKPVALPRDYECDDGSCCVPN